MFGSELSVSSGSIARCQISVGYIQDDQKVSLHLMMYCNRQVHRDLITLYNPHKNPP